MATRSRARMFHATAKALNAAAEQRLEGAGEYVLSASVEDIDFDMDLSELQGREADGAAAIVTAVSSISREELLGLHDEFRWAESKLMQASERLAEAQEARRKDLVALACMRRELRGSFAAERGWVRGQLRLFEESLPGLELREQELVVLVDGGAITENIIRELAHIRAERKLYALAIGQSYAQLGRIDENESTLEHEVASEAYDLEPDGRTMRELARLRSEATRTKRESVAGVRAARELLESLGIDTTHGEVTAIGSFLAAEFEGDVRGRERMERVRGSQVGYELSALPQPSSPWKAGLRHPVTFMRARRVSSPER